MLSAALSHTARGARHVKHETPCEDASGHVADAQGRYLFAAIADGHGDSSCMRSERGSAFAIEAARTTMGEFAEYVLARGGFAGAGLWDVRDATTGGLTARRLCVGIVSAWRKLVSCDLEQEPLAEDELAEVPESKRSSYLEGTSAIHAYGTTLIACLVVDGMVLLVQQGDGHCDVFRADGRADQPIPWDERCHDVNTTSICNQDAATAMRSWVIDTRADPLTGIFMGSDGVEDQFSDSLTTMEGVHCFYRDVARLADELGLDSSLDEVLEQRLSAHSAGGNGDDVSVAAVLDTDAVHALVPSFSRLIDAYNLRHDIDEVELAINSKTRKHGILERRLETLRAELAERESRFEKLRGEFERAEGELAELRGRYEEAEREFREFDEAYQELKERLVALRSDEEAFRAEAVGAAGVPAAPEGDTGEDEEPTDATVPENDSGVAEGEIEPEDTAGIIENELEPTGAPEDEGAEPSDGLESSGASELDDSIVEEVPVRVVKGDSKSKRGNASSRFSWRPSWFPPRS